MRCTYHPTAVIYFEEVTDYKKHPFTGELVRLHREMPVCPDCFEKLEKTGVYNPKIEQTEQDHLESQVDSHIDSLIAKRGLYGNTK